MLVSWQVPETPLIAHEGEDGVALISISDDLDEENATQFESLIGRCDLAYPVMVDLTKCTYISSVPISVLVRARRDRGTKFHVRISDRGIVHRVFEISGLITHLAIVEHGGDGMRA